jgi:hypothetical protein
MTTMLRYALFAILFAAATTGLGLSMVFGTVGIYYMVHGMLGLSQAGGFAR